VRPLAKRTSSLGSKIAGEETGRPIPSGNREKQVGGYRILYEQGRTYTILGEGERGKKPNSEVDWWGTLKVEPEKRVPQRGGSWNSPNGRGGATE